MKQAKTIKNNLMINMHPMWKFSTPLTFLEAAERVASIGKGDLLIGMEKIKKMRSDDIYDEDDFRRRVYTVNAYLSVLNSMSLLLKEKK